MPSLQIRRQRTMALETFKIINQLTPVCLQNLVNVKKSKYSFRYNNIVDIPQVKTTIYGKKSFRYAAAAMWNSLPDHFRTKSSFSQFKSLIQSWNGTECRCSAQISQNCFIFNFNVCLHAFICLFLLCFQFDVTLCM